MKNNINAYSKSEKCCGCGACSNICPKNAIEMKTDKKGFLHPEINMEKCVNCGLCLKVCAFNQKRESIDLKQVDVYAVKNRNYDIRQESRSGGVFTALTDKCIEHGGVVYGVALNEKFEAVHKSATTKQERDLFRGSKYIQSVVGDSYKRVKEDLLQGKEVIYSGTPCQVNALKCYLNGIDCSKLLLIDIVCHGVPSVRVWKDYLAEYEKKKNGKVTNVDFRNKKKYGWAGCKETISVDGKEYDDDMFFDFFNSGLIERASCFKCPYKTLERVGDITIGDYWGINKVNKEFNDNKGVSLVLCNTEKGKAYFESVEDVLEVIETNIQNCLQPALQHNSKMPKDRSFFWGMYDLFGKIKFARIYHYKLKVGFKLKHMLKRG